MAADGAEGVEHLGERHARQHLRRPGGPARRASSAARWTAACWRTSRLARWKPNVASLPAQVLDLAVGDARQAVGDEGVLDLDQLLVQRGRRRVPPSAGAVASTSRARVRRSRSAMKPKRWR